jgi:hypothetical protein
MQYSVCEVDPNRCPYSLPFHSEVKNSESIGRILHSGIAPTGIPDEQTFPLDDLLLMRSGSIDHDCGNSDGASVQRLLATTMDDLLQRSREIAAKKPNRKPFGVAIGSVDELRRIRLSQLPGQVVFLLPDGSEKDPGHSVIRMSPDVPDGLRRKVRKAIIDAFKKVIPA